MKRFDTIETNLIHGGLDERLGGAVVPPVFQSANFLMADESEYAAIRYGRLSNSPNHLLLADRLALLEGAEAATVTSSGMAAITTALLSVLSAGDHLMIQQTVYGGTWSFVAQDLVRFGISHTTVDARRPETWLDAVRPNTKALYVEGVSNPLMQVPELKAAVDFCRDHGLVSLIDNTFLSPYNFRPIPLGFDLVLHSATKYLNGHSDVIAGVIAGSTELLDKTRALQNHLGPSLDPHACFLLERGLKTLHLRMARHNIAASQIARLLNEHPNVERVHYPDLASDPGFSTALDLFEGCGGMLSFVVKTDALAEQFVKRVKLALHAASLGGPETLVVRPARSSHLGMDPEERAQRGITDRLIRVSVGLEDPTEIGQDLLCALEGP